MRTKSIKLLELGLELGFLQKRPCMLGRREPFVLSIKVIAAVMSLRRALFTFVESILIKIVKADVGDAL